MHFQRHILHFERLEFGYRGIGHNGIREDSVNRPSSAWTDGINKTFPSTHNMSPCDVESAKFEITLCEVVCDQFLSRAARAYANGWHLIALGSL